MCAENWTGTAGKLNWNVTREAAPATMIWSSQETQVRLLFGSHCSAPSSGVWTKRTHNFAQKLSHIC